MAESPSAALPGGIEWVPALGGARLLRAEAGPGDPPALILYAPGGGPEHRIEPGPEARFSRNIEYLVPGDVAFNRASLVWHDGTHVSLPLPPSPGKLGSGEILEFRTRRTPPEAVRGTPPVGAPRGLGWAAAPPPPSPRLVAAGVAAAKPWTALPESAAVHGAAEAEWRVRRADLERELSHAAEALSRARAGERAARDSVLATLESVRADLRAARAAREADASALATLTTELDAERSAHAVTRGTAMTLAEALAAARADAAIARAELEAERTARVREAALLRPAAPPSDDATLQQRAREQAEAAAATARRPPEQTGRLLADLAAAAATLRATIPEPDADEPAAEAGAGPLSGAAGPPAAGTTWSADAPPSDAAATPAAEPSSGAPTAGPPAVGKAWSGDAPSRDVPVPALLAAAPAALVTRGGGWLPPVVAEPAVVGSPGAGWSAGMRPVALAPRDLRRLRRGLVALAREDGVTAAALIAGLLPAQGALLEDDVSYDLTVRGLGTFAISVEGGEAHVRRLDRRRRRGEAQFHLTGDPLVLAELLAGERPRIRRFRGVARLSGRRKDLKALRPLAASDLSLAAAVTAGVRLEPALVYRTLPHVVDPEWTRGHVFTVAQEIVELAPRAWYITARDGVPLTVTEHKAGHAADATVTMTRATFDRLLRGEPALEGERPVVRGDRAAVEALRRWTDMARGVG